jgi:hypothetical protein
MGALIATFYFARPMRLRRVAAIAFFILASIPPSSPSSAAVAKARPPAECGLDSYINSSGHCVHRPVQAPRPPIGASARCRDGTYSFSEHRRGTCSHHGGVAQWL